MVPSYAANACLILARLTQSCRGCDDQSLPIGTLSLATSRDLADRLQGAVAPVAYTAAHRRNLHDAPSYRAAVPDLVLNGRWLWLYQARPFASDRKQSATYK